MTKVPDIDDYYPHESVKSRIRSPDAAAELTLFDGRTGPAVSGEALQARLVDRVTAFGEAQGFHVVTLAPGTDVFAPLNRLRQRRILAILSPGEYYETAFRVNGNWDDLWLYGIPADGARPRVLALRKRGNRYGSPPTFFAASRRQRLFIENLEIGGFAGNTVAQGAEADLLIRNCFIHSNGGRALFRGVGCYFSPHLGGTYLVDSEFRDASSHTVYLDYGDIAVISGCRFSRQGRAKHTIKNISRRTLVENSTFATGMDGIRGSDGTNAWVAVSNAAGSPREYSGSAAYDGMSGTDFALVRNNRIITPGSNGVIASLQTRTAATGNLPAHPLPEVEWKGMAQAHLDACSYHIETDLAPGWGFTQRVAERDFKTGAAPSVMWTDRFWDEFQPRTQYWVDNTFEVRNGREQVGYMIGISVAHGHPTSSSQDRLMRHLEVPAAWHRWLTEKLDGRATVRFYHRGNVFPPGLIRNISWIGGIDQFYGDRLPPESDAIQALDGEPPEATTVSPMLRRWTAKEFLVYTGQFAGAARS
ncbi:MAG: right-handed parallel beta-helix repeat-containing protein [Gammaproteobacteria bacterium]|nr:right-handed parallel beta-helix repeat-containing protein [Gammaproteobacteria bacterium]